MGRTEENIGGLEDGGLVDAVETVCALAGEFEMLDLIRPDRNIFSSRKRQ